LDDEIFSEAGGVLKMNARTPDDREYYDDRIHYLPDQESRLRAVREQALEEGIKLGIKQGLEQVSVAGKIQFLYQLLGETEPAMPELLELGEAELASMLAELMDRLRPHGN